MLTLTGGLTVVSGRLRRASCCVSVGGGVRRHPRVADRIVLLGVLRGGDVDREHRAIRQQRPRLLVAAAVLGLSSGAERGPSRRPCVQHGIPDRGQAGPERSAQDSPVGEDACGHVAVDLIEAARLVHRRPRVGQGIEDLGQRRVAAGVRVLPADREHVPVLDDPGREELPGVGHLERPCPRATVVVARPVGRADRHHSAPPLLWTSTDPSDSSSIVSGDNPAGTPVIDFQLFAMVEFSSHSWAVRMRADSTPDIGIGAISWPAQRTGPQPNHDQARLQCPNRPVANPTRAGPATPEIISQPGRAAGMRESGEQTLFVVLEASVWAV